MKKKMPIHDILKDIDDVPGVYRLIGIEPLTDKKNSVLYVGKAGMKAWQYYNKNGKKVQMIRGRLGRHLKNDAGELNKLISDIRKLTKIEYWVINPKIFDNEQEFINALDYSEYYLRKIKGPIPYNDKLKLSTPLFIKPLNENIKQFVTQLFEDDDNNRKIIPIIQLSENERKLQNYFKLFLTSPFRDKINFRQYKDVYEIMEDFVNCWNQFKDKKYNWHKFEV